MLEFELQRCLLQARVKFHVMVTSYEVAVTEASLLNGLEWESLVVDEGHRLKNKNSKLFTVSVHHASIYLDSSLQWLFAMALI